jgi:hypothetical protein
LRGGLDPEARLTTELDDGEPEGFALLAWRQKGGTWPVPGKELLSFRLRMGYGGAEPYSVQAALVVVERHDGALFWDADDFFVPPGLWGVGIGGDFLRKLGDGRVVGSDATLLVARIQAAASRGTAARQQLANEMQLYRSAGFTEVEPVIVDGIATLGAGVTTAAVPASLLASERPVLRQWMVREVGTAEQRAAMLAAAAAVASDPDA